MAEMKAILTELKEINGAETEADVVMLGDPQAEFLSSL